jgi:hypothetical protein
VNSKYREYYKTYVASYVDYVIRKFIDDLDVLKNLFHIYKSRDRTYYVYKYNDKLWSLLEQIFLLAEFLNSYRVLKYRKKEIVDSIISKCKDIEKCIDTIIDTENRLEIEIEKRRKSGKKALFTRLMRNTQKCKSLIDKYFSDLNNYYVFDVSSNCKDYYTSECEQSVLEVLIKFFAEDVARRYAHSISIMRNSVYLFVRDGIFAIKTSNTTEYFRLFCDDCVDNEKYALVKLVGVILIDNTIDRVDWVAILGLDKHTNQIFLHYVPKTLVFRDVEVCRLWVMGLADEFGSTVSDVELVEV